MLYDVIVRGRLAVLIKRRTGTPNNPPIWVQQPNPVFAQGTAANYSLRALTFDPDLEVIDITLNAVSLPTGVTYNGTLDRLEYNGSGPVASTSGHVATASDGTDTTDSIAFSIRIQDVSNVIGFPRIAIHHIGGRTESAEWGNSTFQERVAVCHDLTTNFAPADIAFIAQRIAAIRSHNSGIRVNQYNDWSAFALGSSVQVERRDYVVANHVTPGQPGGNATDGMSRRPDGTQMVVWPNKEDLNHTDFPNEYLGQIPAVYNAVEQYKDFHSGSLSTTFDEVYQDIWRWYGRFEDGPADWNRNGVNNTDRPGGRYGNFSDTETINAAMIRAKEAIHSAIQVEANSDRGEDIPILGNIGSWSDYFDGAQAQDNVLTTAPSEMVAITEGGLQENWGRLLGFNSDGSARNGSFERGYKSIERLVSFVNTSSHTNTKRIWAHAYVNSGLYDLAAYMCGVATMAGAYFWWAQGSDHKNPGELDEFFGQSESGLTTAQKVSALGWMGLPIGAPPEHGGTYIANTRGGIIQNGVYARHFTDDGTSGGTDTGFLLVNPAGNGNQTITAPAGSWKRINGSQRSDNTGNNVSGTVSITAGRSLFLEPQ